MINVSLTGVIRSVCKSILSVCKLCEHKVFNAVEGIVKCKPGKCSFEKHQLAFIMYKFLTIGTKARPLQP